jgi:hypothetical protein
VSRIFKPLVIVLISACDPLATSFEAKPLGNRPLIIAGTAMPEPAQLAKLTPCPLGWTEQAASAPDGPVTCEPWSGGKPKQCAADEANFVGEPACARLGSVCPAGDFPEAIVGSPVRYVRVGASAGGTGTLAAPFASIAAALVGATPGTVVAVAKGTYDEAVRVPAGVTLWGACVAQTLVSASAPHASIGTVTPMGANVTVRNLTIGGERPGVVVGVASASASLEDVAILNTKGFGVVVANGVHASAKNLLVRGVRASTQNGNGLYAEGGASLSLTRVAVEQIVGLGLVAFEAGSRIEGSRVSVVEGTSVAGGTMGNAIEATLDGRVSLQEYALESNHEYAVYAATRAVVSLLDGVVRDTQPRPTDLGLGVAFSVLAGGRIEATRTTLERNHSFGIYVSDPASTVQLTDTVIRDTQPEKRSEGSGFGLVLMSGARAEVSRLTVQKSRAAGVSVHLPGSTLIASDLTVLDTLGQQADGAGGDGIVIARGANAQLKRARLERNRSSGLGAGDPGTMAVAEDLTVRSTLGALKTRDSSGVWAQDHGVLTLRRALLEENQQLGMVAIDAAIDAEDLVVRDTRGENGNGIVGRGAQVQQRGQLVVRRGLFEDNREAGIAAIDEQSKVTLEDVVVRGTRRRDCVPSCPDEGGSGIVALGGAQIAARRFAVSTSVMCGVELSDRGTMDLIDGLVSANTIGVCLLTMDFDTNRLDQGVLYFDNASKFSGDFIPLPSFRSPTRPPIDPSAGK